MWRCRWLTWSLVGVVSLGADMAHAQQQDEQDEQTEQDEEYERPPRPEKPPIQLVESGPFKVKDKRGYRNLVVIGPRLLPPGIGGRFVHSVTDYVAVMVGGGYSGWELFGATLRHVDARAGIDYQPIGNGLDGFYIGPRAVYRSFLGSFESEGGTSGLQTRTVGVGGVVGWRAIWDPGLSLGAGVGGLYTTWLGRMGDLEEGQDLEITGTAPMLELTLGFAF
jgi:hypothetical protein